MVWNTLCTGSIPRMPGQVMGRFSLSYCEYGTGYGNVFPTAEIQTTREEESPSPICINSEDEVSLRL